MVNEGHGLELKNFKTGRKMPNFFMEFCYNVGKSSDLNEAVVTWLRWLPHQEQEDAQTHSTPSPEQMGST